MTRVRRSRFDVDCAGGSGSRLATQVVASVLAWKTAMGNEGMAAMHGISQNTLDHMTLDLLEINETEVRTYAGTMLDEIFTNSNIAV